MASARRTAQALHPTNLHVNKQLFREWYPQIIFNQHQTGPNGMVVFVPPFRDPFNFNYDPLVMTELQEVGMAMHSRLVAEDKPGSGARSAAPYSTWHNGMERSVAYFHNSIGLLTEIIGGPTPTTVNLVPELQLPGNDRPAPIAPPATAASDVRLSAVCCSFCRIGYERTVRRRPGGWRCAMPAQASRCRSRRRSSRQPGRN